MCYRSANYSHMRRFSFRTHFSKQSDKMIFTYARKACVVMPCALTFSCTRRPFFALMEQKKVLVFYSRINNNNKAVTA